MDRVRYPLRMTTRMFGAVCTLVLTAACTSTPAVEPADTILTNARVYTFTWDDPAADGTPAATAPHTAEGWRPDAEAVAIRAGRIVFTGTTQQTEAYRGPATRVIDLQGATALPGLVDSHVHIRELGQAETQLDLTGVATEEDAVARTVAYAATVPKGEWVIGRGWDEGAWAGRYPTMRLLSERVPDHPVVLDSLHGFAVWGNRLAFEKAGITRATRPPVGGEILKDATGEPTGTLLNRAVTLLEGAVPPPTPDAGTRLGAGRTAAHGPRRLHRRPRSRRRRRTDDGVRGARGLGRPAGARLRHAVRARYRAQPRLADEGPAPRPGGDVDRAIGEGLLRRLARVAWRAPDRRLRRPEGAPWRQRRQLRIRPGAGGRDDDGGLPGRHPRHRRRRQSRDARLHPVRAGPRRGRCGTTATASSTHRSCTPTTSRASPRSA